ncbi:LysM domain-containing protein [Bacillus gobiensis]|uniref:LysM peptidoglycan-binding domain-containing protein n=1 Tax=Bacillus gobiensis TaxID=1441095 RepID=UPI003D1FB3A6
MKRIIIVVSLVFLSFIVYYDLSRGTNPIPQEKQQEEPKIQPVSSQAEEGSVFQTHTVKKGETVFSIVDQKSGGSPPISAEQIVEDFERLNPETKANLIQSGKVYKFPVYDKSS